MMEFDKKMAYITAKQWVLIPTPFFFKIKCFHIKILPSNFYQNFTYILLALKLLIMFKFVSITQLLAIGLHLGAIGPQQVAF